MKSLLGRGEAAGMTFVAASPALGAEPVSDGWSVSVGGRDPVSIRCRAVINAAGLRALELSRWVFPDRPVPELYPSKGCYVRYSGKSPISRIVYPAVVPGQIEERVDAAPDLSGSLRFGPNVEVPENLDDFGARSNLAESFIPAIKRYLPNLDESKLHPDQAGIRPKIYAPGEAPADFMFEWAAEPGWLDLWGMESPGLTASLAVAEHARGLLKDKGINPR